MPSRVARRTLKNGGRSSRSSQKMRSRTRGGLNLSFTLPWSTISLPTQVKEFAKYIDSNTSADFVLTKATEMLKKPGMLKALNETIVDVPNNLTLLCLTIAHGNSKAAIALLKAGIDGSIGCGKTDKDALEMRMTSNENENKTPLMFSAGNKKITSDDMREMFDYYTIRKTLNKQDTLKRNALQHAVYAILHFIINNLRRNKSNPFSTNYTEDSLENDLSKIRFLIENGASKELDAYTQNPVSLAKLIADNTTKYAVLEALGEKSQLNEAYSIEPNVNED